MSCPSELSAWPFHTPVGEQSPLVPWRYTGLHTPGHFISCSDAFILVFVRPGPKGLLFKVPKMKVSNLLCKQPSTTEIPKGYVIITYNMWKIKFFKVFVVNKGLLPGDYLTAVTAGAPGPQTYLCHPHGRWLEGTHEPRPSTFLALARCSQPPREPGNRHSQTLSGPTMGPSQYREHGSFFTLQRTQW